MTAGVLSCRAVCGCCRSISLVVRYRRSSGVARSQIRWIALGGALSGGIHLRRAELRRSGPGRVAARSSSAWSPCLALMVSYGIAITKYRLYDIDIVISRTVTYGVLAVIITACVCAPGGGCRVAARRWRRTQPGCCRSCAVAVVAVAFEPLRNRVQHAANRLVFGNRASPYEVLAKATSRLANTGAPEETLAQVTRLVVDGTGAAEAVLLAQGRGLTCSPIQPHRLRL